MDNYEDPLPGKTYISPSLKSFSDPERRVRIATKLIEQPTTYAYAHEKGELVLRHKEDAKSTITAKFFEDDRGIFVLSIQGYTIATAKPHNASFSFVGDEIGRLIEFLNHIQSMPLNGGGPMKITDEQRTQAGVRSCNPTFSNLNSNARRMTMHDCKNPWQTFEPLQTETRCWRQRTE